MSDSSGITDTTVAEAWHTHHGHLLDVAYRMLGSVSDAEDVVQDAFARLLHADLEGIDDLRGWLVVVVSRLCLDHLRSARVRRERYVGPWLPDPIIPSGDALGPEERVTLDDTVRTALLLVLERLSPAERVAFILHDVFQYSFDDIARITKRTPAASRQLASRARQHVKAEGGALRSRVDPEEARTVTDRFLAAAASGNLRALLDVLDPEVAGWTDSGGVVPAPRDSIVGAQRVAERLLWWLQTFEVTLMPMRVSGGAGAIALQDGDVIAAIAIDVDNGVITALHAVANPEKLSYVRAALGAREGPPLPSPA